MAATQPSFGTTFEPQLPCKWKIQLKTGKQFQGLETTWGGSWVTTSSLAIESNSTETERETLPVLRYFRSPRVVESGDRKSEIARVFDEQPSRPSAYEGWNHSFLPLARLDAWALRERMVGQETGSNTGWELFCAALSTVMPAFRSAHFNASENALILVKGEGEVRATDLSEGERAVLGLVGDLVRRCFRLNAHLGSEVLLKSPGIILVDELDEHLHPALALTILPALLEVFPAMQFIVASHSPQVWSSAPQGSVFRILVDENSNGTLQPIGYSEGAMAQLLLGAESVPLRSPTAPMTQLVSAYEQHLREGTFESDKAAQIFEEIRAISQGDEPALIKLRGAVALAKQRRALKP